MGRYRFQKLVRDKIVEHQIHSGGKPRYRQLGKDEHVRELVKKITEEAQEILEASGDTLADEIADVQQALDDLKNRLHVTDDQIRTAQVKKYDKNGGFAKGIFVEDIELDDDNVWAKYYRENPDRYPKIED